MYRDGRIDEVMTFKGLDETQAHDFVKIIADTFSVKLAPENVSAAVKSGFSKDGTPSIYASQAALTQAVYEQVKIITLLNNS